MRYSSANVHVKVCVQRHFRRQCLFEMQSDLHEELDMLDGYADENPKNYQIWSARVLTSN
jgi:hypothetical protein